jgi:site-specific recombinase XerD
MHPPRLSKRLTEVLSPAQMEAILGEAASAPAFERRRDTALIHMFRSSGARRAEIAGLTMDAFDLNAGTIRVIGKGDKERRAFLDDDARDALEAYVRQRKRHDHADLPWLWLGRKGRLTDSGIAQVIREIGLRAGVPGLHPHLFRHTWNSDLDRAGVSIEHRMSLAGWQTDKMPRYYGATTLNDRALDAARDAMARRR